MKNILFILLLALSFFRIQAQELQGDERETKFIEDVFAKDFFLSKRLVGESLNTNAIKRIIKSAKTIALSHSELDSFSKQLATDKKQWLVSRSNNIHLVDWDNYVLKPSERMYNYSKPYFFNDNKSCLFYKSDYYGRMCAGSELAVYKLDNTKWVFAYHLFKRSS